MNWMKGLTFPSSSRNEREYEMRRNLHKEGRSHILRKEVWTSENEIQRMAEIVDEHDRGAERFLRILKQDDEAFSVAPEDVYPLRDDEPYWPEGGFTLEEEEVQWLRELSCDISDQKSVVDVTEARKGAIEQFTDLCEFLQIAEEVELCPKIFRGDQ